MWLWNMGVDDEYDVRPLWNTIFMSYKIKKRQELFHKKMGRIYYPLTLSCNKSLKVHSL